MVIGEPITASDRTKVIQNFMLTRPKSSPYNKRGPGNDLRACKKTNVAFEGGRRGRQRYGITVPRTAIFNTATVTAKAVYRGAVLGITVPLPIPGGRRFSSDGGPVEFRHRNSLQTFPGQPSFEKDP